MNLVTIAQGSAGTIENGNAERGFYTDKVENCRVYVFHCANGTVFMHDSGQLSLEDIKKYLAEHGEMLSVSYADGQKNNQEDMHNSRLTEITSHFNCSEIRSLKIDRHAFNVAYLPEHGLVDFTNELPSDNNMIIDPNLKAREAINILNNYFTESNSQNVSLDIQYRVGNFTQLPELKLSVLEMLRTLKNDKENGLLGAVALSHYGHEADLELPNTLKNFIKAQGLESALYNSRHPVHNDNKIKTKLFGQFRQLPIFK